MTNIDTVEPPWRDTEQQLEAGQVQLILKGSIKPDRCALLVAISNEKVLI
jgi:hypothetical protein